MKEIMLQVKPVAGEIQTNFDAIEKQLAEDMRQYDGLVFTEDTKTEAKKTVADLRKLKKSIDDSRKEVKTLWMEPYNKFEARVKQMVALVDGPINCINGQVEAFEAKRLEERKEEIQKIYDAEIGELADFLPLYRIQEDKWFNSSTTLKAIRKDMETVITNTRSGKAAIEAMQSDVVPNALKKFQSTLNLPDALAYINQYEIQKAETLRREAERLKLEEERKHQAEIERIRTEERQRVAAEERIRNEAKMEAVKELKEVDETASAPLSSKESKRVIYTVVATEEELGEIEMALTGLGIYFERKDV